MRGKSDHEHRRYRRAAGRSRSDPTPGVRGDDPVDLRDPARSIGLERSVVQGASRLDMTKGMFMEFEVLIFLGECKMEQDLVRQ